MKFQTTLRLSDVFLRRPFQLLISLLRLIHLDRDFSMLDTCLRQIHKLLKCQSQQWSQHSGREQEKKEVAFPTWKFMPVVRRSSKVAVLWSEGRWLVLAVPSVGFCYSIREEYAWTTIQCLWNHLPLRVLGSVLSTSDERSSTKHAPSPSTWNSLPELLSDT